MQERIHAIAGLMRIGFSPLYIVKAAEQRFGIGARMTRRYMHRIREKWARELRGQSYSAQLVQARYQRDRLFERAQEQLDKCTSANEFAAVMRACDRNLRERDNLIREAYEHSGELVRPLRR